MLKKIFILFISINLCAADDIKKPESPSSNSSMKVIGIGLAALTVYTIMPKLLEGTNGKHLATIGGAALSVYGLSQLYDIGIKMDESLHTSETKKASADEAHKKIAVINAKRAFRSCLMNNANKQRNSSGIPTECEDLACKYSVVAGKSELDDMTKTFNDTYGN